MSSERCWYCDPATGACYRSKALHHGAPCPGACSLFKTREQVQRLRGRWGVESQPRPQAAVSPELRLVEGEEDEP